MKRAALFSTLFFGAVWLLGTGCTDKSPVNPDGDPNTDISQLMYQPTLNTATYQEPLYIYSRNDIDAITQSIDSSGTTPDTVYDTTYVETTVTSYPPVADTSFAPKEALEDSVVLVWSSTFTGGTISNDSLYKYYIYRGRSAATVFLLDSVSGVLDSAGTKVDTLPVTWYVDDDIIPDVTNDFFWYYQVSAGKLNGYEGAKSDVKSVLIPHTYYYRRYKQ